MPSGRWCCLSIELRGVHKRFDEKVVLDGVDLVVEEVQTMAIIGRSGGGKSVLRKHFVWLLEPHEDVVLVDGREFAGLRREELYELRRNVGYVFHFAALFNS